MFRVGDCVKRKIEGKNNFNYSMEIKSFFIDEKLLQKYPVEQSIIATMDNDCDRLNITHLKKINCI